MSIDTLADLFLVTAEHHKPDHLLVKEGEAYRPISTAELVDRVRRVARALERWGIAPGDRVALMADNGPHWPVVDFATLCRGAATVPVYPTLLPDQAAYVIADSGAKAAFVHRRSMLQCQTLSGDAGFQHLLYGLLQAFGIVEHGAVELEPLTFGNLA